MELFPRAERRHTNCFLGLTSYFSSICWVPSLLDLDPS
jgi:hypothetical protein